MSRGYGTPELCYKYNYSSSIARQVAFFTPTRKMSSLFSPAHVNIILSVFDCGLDDISNPEDGSLFYNTTTLGSVVMFECFGNFALLGESETTCQRTGWSNSNPTCGKEWIYVCINSCTLILLIILKCVAFKMFSYRLIYVLTCSVVQYGLISE